jgi:N-methylhydantoinase B
MPVRSPVNVVTVEILRNLFQACAEDMNAALIRSAYSPIIYEGKDCSVALLDDEGNVLGHSSGLPIFLGNLEVCVHHTLAVRGRDSIKPGDAYFLNDPYIQGTHINDATIFAPIFWHDELVGFAASRAHWLDIGAKDPGATMDSTEVYQEGLRAGPTKIYEDYEPVEDILDLLRRNSRFGDLLMGDLNAQVTACRTGEQRFRSALDRFGLETVRAARDVIFAQSEELEREAIREIPDGVYEAEGCLDDDGINADPVWVRVKVTVDDDAVSVDLDGTSPMCQGPVNVGFAQTISAVRVAYKMLINPDRSPDGGSFKTLTVTAPEGSILHAIEPAACQWYFTPLSLLIDLLVKALSPVMYDVVAGAHYGDSMVIGLTGTDTLRGGGRFYDISPTPGGWGGYSTGDGQDALVNVVNGGFKDIPVEIFETKYPMRIAWKGLRPDSGGPGRQRGGCGLWKKIIVDVDTQLYLWWERSKTPGWGLFDGQAGHPPVIEIAGSQSVRDCFKVNNLSLRAGDSLTVMTGGGGGFGEPLERDPEAVAADVRDGLVSQESAERDSGVILTGEGLAVAVDVEATARRRASAPASRPRE